MMCRIQVMLAKIALLLIGVCGAAALPLSARGSMFATAPTAFSACADPLGTTVRIGLSLPFERARSFRHCFRRRAPPVGTSSSPPGLLLRMAQSVGDDTCDEDDAGNTSQQPRTNEPLRTLLSSPFTREDVLRSLSIFPLALTARSNVALARGLVKFPCVGGLGNTYHFMRAGQSLLEEEDVISTNPLFLTNREAALSDYGIKQVEETCQRLREADVNPTIVRYSIAASSVDSANIVGKELRVGRDRLVPEFNLMDPRAIGQYDMLSLNSTEAAVWALDVDEAGVDGTGGRPPPNEDGTPHETLANQVTRLTNLLSVLETLYSGDTVLLIFPDGTGPALLSALIAGIPLNRVHELNFSPGEVRLDISVESIRQTLPAEPPDYYKEIINRGRGELKGLRLKGENIVSVKDQRLEKERIEIEEDLAKKRAEQEAARAKEEAQREARREAMLREQRERQNKRDAAVAEQEIDTGSSSATVFAGIAVAGLAGAVALLNEADSGSARGGSVDELADEPLETVDTANASTAESGLHESDAVNATKITESIQDLGVTVTSTSSPRTRLVAGFSNEASAPKDNDATSYQRAEEAMKTYMDQDDGGDAWIAALSEIMSEEDEDLGQEDTT